MQILSSKRSYRQPLNFSFRHEFFIVASSLKGQLTKGRISCGLKAKAHCFRQKRRLTSGTHFSARHLFFWSHLSQDSRGNLRWRAGRPSCLRPYETNIYLSRWKLVKCRKGASRSVLDPHYLVNHSPNFYYSILICIYSTFGSFFFWENSAPTRWPAWSHSRYEVAGFR